MTVRYTAIEDMNDPAIREFDRNAERWRDKIEVRLDNRQVFFLFFGSAIVACMLFVLGVLVGKRIESRGQAASPELQDPLAALDRAQVPAAAVTVAPTPQLTFPSTLIGTSATTAKPSKAAKLASLAPAPKPVVAPPAPRPAATIVAPPKAIAPAAPAPKAAAAKPTAAAPSPSKVIAVAEPRAEQKPEAKAEQKKGKFTLHLSTFASAEEANAFAQRYPGAFVVSGDVPGRGMTYRVRYGNFPTYKDATSAKDNFEKQHNVIALIAAR